MIFHTLYIEEDLLEHPQSIKIQQIYSQAVVVKCNYYGEIFNRKSQDFRMQKGNMALIIAKKNGRAVLPAPVGYNIGGEHNFYFSTTLNCIYDCRYCFLQGMYRSAYVVIFINHEHFLMGIDSCLDAHPNQPVWFFSGYDGDSLALEPISSSLDYLLPFFANRPNGYLELRTKSTQIRQLLNAPPQDNVIVAFSLTPPGYASRLESGVPQLDKRLKAAAKLQKMGWKIGLRFDPILYDHHFQSQYQQLFSMIQNALDLTRIHSVCYGEFRLPVKFYKRMRSLYPEESLFAGPLHNDGDSISYKCKIEEEIENFINRRLNKIFPAGCLYRMDENVSNHT